MPTLTNDRNHIKNFCQSVQTHRQEEKGKEEKKPSRWRLKRVRVEHPPVTQQLAKFSALKSWKVEI